MILEKNIENTSVQKDSGNIYVVMYRLNNIYKYIIVIGGTKNGKHNSKEISKRVGR